MIPACEILLVIALFGSTGDYSVQVRCMPSFNVCAFNVGREWQSVRRSHPDHEAIIECVMHDGMVGRGSAK